MCIFYKTKELPFFIKALKFGEEKGIDGFTLDEFDAWVTSVTKKANDLTKKTSQSVLSECFEEVKYAGNVGGLHRVWVLRSEYYSRLLEWRELQEARIASKQANKNAFRAIIVSVLAVGITGYLAWTQMKTPLTLSNDSIENIGKSISTHISKKP